MALFSPLPHRALVAVAGDDRIAFLQGLVSNDMRHVEAGRAIWAAFLTPQGKFLHEFFVFPRHDTVMLECERERRDDLIKRLARYKLRAKVTLAPDDTLTVGVSWGDGAAAAFKSASTPGTVTEHGVGVVYADPRLEGAGVRWALSQDQVAGLEKLGLKPATSTDYDVHRIGLGLPDGSRDMEVEKALLLENGFEELHGVDFKKGCYIGQELTARTHYRALIKKRLMPVKIEGPAPAAGSALTAGDKEAGEMKSAQGGHGLALVRLDALQPAGTVLRSGETKVTPTQPSWLRLPADETPA